jgi:putative endonuclease
MHYYVYILKCKDGTLYTGWTNDLEARLTAHREGRGAKYTRHKNCQKAVALDHVC